MAGLGSTLSGGYCHPRNLAALVVDLAKMAKAEGPDFGQILHNEIHKTLYIVAMMHVVGPGSLL